MGDAQVLTVALNCGVDKVYDCPGFGLKGIHQPARSVTCVGGKAVNQARMLRTLGVPVLVTGFAGGLVGEQVQRQLRAEGVPHDFEPTQDESRLAITILDSVSDTHTEVNEWGPLVSPAELRSMLERYRRLLDGVALVSLAGSAPPGVPCGIYEQMIAAAHARGVAVLLDARGEWLRGGMRAGPEIVKPNQTELGQLLGATPGALEDAARAASALCDLGPRWVSVTLGAEGALAAADGRVWHAWAERIRGISAVGSGDAFAAALAAGWVRGRPVEDTLRLAVACGTASAMRLGPAFATSEEVDEMAGSVRIREVGA